MKKKYKQEEYEDQVAIFKWARHYQRKYPELHLLNGSLNGVRLTIGQAVKAKKAGMKKGFPDISLPVPKSRYHGLYIELKKEKGGRVSPDQKEKLELLRIFGNFACVCEGRFAAIDVIKKYLAGNL